MLPIPSPRPPCRRLQGASASESSAGEGGGEGAEAGSKGGAVLRRAVGAAADYLTSPKGDAPGSGVGASVGQSASSSLGALGHLASEVLGSPRTDQPGHQTDSSLLSSLAAEYLGLHSFNIDSVKSWQVADRGVGVECCLPAGCSRPGAWHAICNYIYAVSGSSPPPRPATLCRLSNPSQFEERNDSKMVGAIVHRLLQSFEDHTGGFSTALGCKVHATA